MKKCKILFIIALLCTYITNVNAFIEPDFELESEATVIYNIDYDQTIFADNGDMILYPASITKVMTSLVILEKSLHYDDEVTITKEMLAGLAAANASVMGLKEGEVITVRDLLYGLLIPSGADAANALAYYSSNQVDAFVNEMNRLANSLGCYNTHFMNPTGLDHEKNYTTANDLIIIMKEALKYDLFREIISTSTYTTAPTNKHPNGITVKSTNKLKDPTSEYFSEYILGGKTGYTKLAQRTFASYGMTSNGLSYIVVSLKAPFEGYSVTSKCFKDQELIYDWLDDHFSTTTLKYSDEYFDTYNILHAFKREFDVHFSEDLNVLVDDEMSISEFRLNPRVLNQYEATIVEGQYVGYVEAINAEGEVVSSAELKTIETIKKSTFVIVCEQLFDAICSYGIYVLIVTLVLYLLIYLLRQKRYENKRKKQQIAYTKRRLKELKKKK